MAKRKGITPTTWAVVGLVIIGIILALGYTGAFSVLKPADKNTGGETGLTEFASCPSDLSTTLTLRAYNILNTSGKEEVGVYGNLYKVVNGEEVLIQEINSATAPTISAECGATYRLRLIGSNGLDAQIVDLRSGDAKVLDDGKAIEFTTKGKETPISLNIKKHADVLVFRGFNIDTNEYLLNNVSVPTTEYVPSGTLFSDAQSGAINIEAGETKTLRFDIKSNSTYDDFSDFGYYILVKANDQEYESPIVNVNGVELRNIKGTLTDYENRAFSDYDAVYHVDGSLTKTGITMKMVISALSDTDPTSDLEVVFMTDTAFRSVKTDAVLYGAVNDGDRTPIFAEQKFFIDMQ